MKYYNISVNGVAYSVSVEETLPALHPWLLLLHPHPRPLRLPLPLLLLPHPLLLLPQALLRSRLRCPATSWT